MEGFFDRGTIPEDPLLPGVRDAIREDRIFPVLFASGLGNMGADRLLDFIVEFLPAATDRPPVKAAPTPNNGTPAERKVSDAEPCAMYVFKTVSDPFAGRITFLKVISGVVKTDATEQNFTRNTSEKLAHLSIMQGKTVTHVPELHAGDIGAVAKLRE